MSNKCTLAMHCACNLVDSNEHVYSPVAEGQTEQTKYT